MVFKNAKDTIELLKTPRLMLRRLTMADVPAIATLGGDWDVASMTSRMPYPYTEVDAVQWIADADDDECLLGIVNTANLIGVCGYLPDGQGAAEIGYWIGKPYWGRGYATEAARALVAHAFRDPAKFVALTCGHFADNPASRRVIEKLGFEELGPVERWCEARKRHMGAVRYKLARPKRVGLAQNVSSGKRPPWWILPPRT